MLEVVNKIGIIGLGYVGLPLAVAMSKHFDVTGFDISAKRISSLCNLLDETGELTEHELKCTEVIFTNRLSDCETCNVFIITVPTPVDEANIPDLSLLKHACDELGSILKKDDLVIFESTVYPGTTRDFCGKILSEKSNLILNKDFYLGYSPERINPGDQNRSVKDIVKVVSGSSDYATQLVAEIYYPVISAGLHIASSLEVAEAAKIIENVQRDINIALINELSEIFYVTGIDTADVLKAAGTKWNFHAYTPGLVGGHCIGIDPYYLKYFADKNSTPSQLISAGREINDSMAKRAAVRFIKKLCGSNISLTNARILVAGVTFKENCPDVRNSKVKDLIKELEAFNCKVDIIDPHADRDTVLDYFNKELLETPCDDVYDGIVISVAHDEYKAKKIDDFRKLLKPNNIIFDLKCIFEKHETDLRL